MAVANYESAYGSLPPAFIADADGQPMHSWRILLLPYIEGQELYDQYDFDQPWNSPSNLAVGEQMPSIYSLPGTTRQPGTPPVTNYVAVVGAQTVWPGATSCRREDITDGPENTILLTENSDQQIHWLEPRDLHFDSMSFQLDAPGGVTSIFETPAIVTVDGDVTSLDAAITPSELRGMLTIAGAEPPPKNAKEIPDGRLRDTKPTPPTH